MKRQGRWFERKCCRVSNSKLDLGDNELKNYAANNLFEYQSQRRGIPKSAEHIMNNQDLEKIPAVIVAVMFHLLCANTMKL